MTLDQGCDTSLGPVQQFCDKLLELINSAKSYGLDNVKKHYVYSELYIWPATLDQGLDISMDPM
jgi:hypothetical protein